MSTVIDERVVEMRFDNEQFEKNIKQTQNSVDKFEKSLSSKSFTSGIDNLAKSIQNVSLDGIARGVEALQERFSTMGIVGMRVISNITDSVMGLIGKINNFVIGGITSGGLARAMNIENAKFSLEGLGIAWNKVKDDIDYGVKSTAYGLDAAASAAASLAASGVKYGGVYTDAAKDVSEMGRALRGISGVAAMTNSDYASIADIFTTVAGNGKLMSMQLMQLSGRSLNAAATIAKYFNNVSDGTVEATDKVKDAIKNLTKGAKVTEANIRDFVSDGKISFDIFAEAMDTTFGDHAKEANKTLNGSFSNMKAAMSRIGALFATPIIEQDSPLVKLINAITTRIDEFKKGIEPTAKVITDFINAIFTTMQDVVDSFSLKIPDGEKIKSFILGILNILCEIEDVLLPLKKDFASIIPFNLGGIISGIVGKFIELANGFKIGSETANNIRSVFRGVAAAISLIYQAITALMSALSPVGSILKSIFSYILKFAAAIGEYLVEIDAAAKKGEFFAKVSEVLRKALSKLADGFKVLIGLLPEVKFPEFKMPDLSAFSHPLEGLKKLLGGLIDLIGRFFTNFKQADGTFKKTILVGGISFLIDRLRLLWGAINSGINPLAGINGILSNLSFSLNSFSKSVRAKALKDIAMAIAILTGSLAVLTFLDQSKIASGLGAITGLLLELFAAMNVMSKIAFASGVTITSMLSLVFATQLLSVSLLIMSFALKKLSSLNWEEIGKGLAAVGGLMLELFLVMSLLSKGGVAVSGGLAFVGIALSISILASAVKKLGDLNTRQIEQGLIAITTFIIAYSVLMAASGIGTTKLTSGLAFIAIASSIQKLSKVVMELGEMDPDALKRGTSAVIQLTLFVGLVMAAFAAISSITTSGFNGTKIMGSMFSLGLALGGFASAIETVSNAVIRLGKMDQNKVNNGFNWITFILIEFAAFAGISAAFSGVSGAITKMAFLMMLFSISLTSMILPLTILGSIDFMVIVKGLGAIVFILAGFAAFAGISIAFNKAALAMLKMAGVMILFSMALSSMILPLLALGSIDFMVIVKGLGAIVLIMAGLGIFAIVSTICQKAALSMLKMAGVLIVLGAAVMLITPPLLLLGVSSPLVIAGLVALTVAFLALAGIGKIVFKFAHYIAAATGAITGLAIAFAIAGAAAFLFSAAFGTMAALGSAGAASVVDAITVIVKALPGLAVGAANALLQFIAVLLEGTPRLIAALGAVIGEICKVIIENAPKIALAFAAVLAGILLLLADFIPKLVETVLDIIAHVLAILAEKLPEIVKLASDVVVNFIKGLNEKLPELVEAVVEFVITFINAFSEAIIKHNQEIIDAIGELIIAILYTLANAAIALWDAGVEMLKELLDGIWEQAGPVLQGVSDFVGDIVDIFGGLVGAVAKICYDVMSTINRILGPAMGLLVPILGPGGIGAQSFNVSEEDIEKYKKQYEEWQKEQQKASSEDVGFGDLAGAGSAIENIPDTKASEQAAKNMTNPEAFEKAGEENGTNYKEGIEKTTQNAIADIPRQESKEIKAEGKEDGQTYAENVNKAVEENVQPVTSSLLPQEQAPAAQNNDNSNNEKAEETIGVFHKLKNVFLDNKEATDELKASEEELADQSDATADAQNNLGGSMGKAGGAAKKESEDVKETIKDMETLREEVSKNVKSQMNLFTEFDRKTELSGEKLLENMRSNVEGIKEWSKGMAELGQKGLNASLLQQLASEGPKSYEKVAAFLQMNGDQLAEANSLYAQSLSLPQAAANQVVESFAYGGMWATEGFIDGLDTKKSYDKGAEFGHASIEGMEGPDGIKKGSPSEYAMDAAKMVVEGMIVGLTTAIDRVEKAGAAIGRAAIIGLGTAAKNSNTEKLGNTVSKKLIIGITGTVSSMSKVTRDYCSNIINIMKTMLSEKEFKEIGKNVFKFLLNGMEESFKGTLIPGVKTTLKNVEKEIGKSFTKIGEYATEGIVKGIESKLPKLTNVVITMMRKAEEAAKSKKGADEHSPSRKFFEIGAYMILGLANGITSNTTALASSITKMTSETVSKFQNAVSKMKDASSFDEDSMILTPVLDLSQVESGLDSVGAMFQNSSFGINASLNRGNSAIKGFSDAISSKKQEPQTVNNYTTFNQTNTSPKALTNSEIYRQTNNLMSSFKNMKM